MLRRHERPRTTRSKSMAFADWWKLARGVNVLMGVVTVAIGALIVGAAGDSGSTPAIILHALSVGFFMAGWNALNDLKDIEADRVNHPDRPLARGIISESNATIFYRVGIGLSFISLVAIVFSHPDGLQGYGWIDSFIIWGMACVLMWSYEVDGLPFDPCLKKRGLAGNLSVSGLIAVVIVFGASAVDNGLSPLPWSVALCAMMIGTAREIVKDIEDMGGDADRQTLPMTAGVEKARMVCWLCSLLGFVAMGLPFAVELFPVGYIIFLAPAMMVLLMVKAPIIKGESTKASKMLKRALLLGMFGFTACGLAVTIA